MSPSSWRPSGCGRPPTSTSLRELDTINICVPTPLRKTKDPDLSYIVAAAEEIAKRLRPGHADHPRVHDLSRERPTSSCCPMLEKGGLKVGKDFFLAFSPERVDPSNRAFNTHNIPKVIGGMTEDCTALAVGALRRRDLDDRSGQLAAGGRDGEAAREHLPRRQHRHGQRAGADVRSHGHRRVGSGEGGGHEAVRLHAVLSRARASAATAFPVDPFYLSWKARQSGFEARFIELAGAVNGAMPHYVVSLDRRCAEQGEACRSTARRCWSRASPTRSDVDDIRESPALDLLHLLHERGADLAYSDPLVPKLAGSAWPNGVDLSTWICRDGRDRRVRLHRRRDRPFVVRLRPPAARRQGGGRHPERHRFAGRARRPPRRRPLRRTSPSSRPLGDAGGSAPS